ncbi:MAG: phospholipid carrier-dependent glycosyltransferase [Nitrosotalea sp.]
MYQINSRRANWFLLGLLVLSGFTHIWNAAEFPAIFFDEGIYMRRAMHVLAGLGPQESFFYDHPYFGQIFLASVLGLIGFPGSLHVSSSPNSISMLYLVPRVVMGMLAIADTFLIYKIAENRYGAKVALISSMLFAVMPITWLVREILLDSILLPFLLLSILLALKSKNSDRKSLMILLSGICMGLAIFTKIPAFAMIPLITYIIYFNEKRPKLVALWLVPVFLIPFLWPLQSIESGQFGLWTKDVLEQAEKHSYGLPYISYLFLQMDPVLFILGIAGIVFCIYRKDYFILMWFVPFTIFLLAMGYNQYFYWIPVLPVFCISASILIVKVLGQVKRKNIHKNFPVAVILGIGVFGLASTLLLITTNMASSEFQATSFVLQHVNDNDNKTTILASPVYSWIFSYVFHKQNVLADYSLALFEPITTEKVVLVADQHYVMVDMSRGTQLEQLYNDTKTVATFVGNTQGYDISLYPYTSLKVNYEENPILIKEK